MNLTCICRSLVEIGDSPTAKAQRQAWRESVEEQLA